MNKEELKKKPNAFLERIKNLNFKKFARGFAIIWMIIFIVVMTITNVGIDKEFNWIKWLGNAMILFGIAVFGLFIGESMGADYTREKPNGLYQRKINEYDTVRLSIEPIVLFFSQFYYWLVPQSLQNHEQTS